MPAATFAVMHLGVGLGAALQAALPKHPSGPFVECAPGQRADAALVHAPDLPALQSLAQGTDLERLAFETAVVVLAPGIRAAEALTLVQRGVQDVIDSADVHTVARALRHAVERKRLERAARTAYATDLATGLPHEAQLVEHMTQLLALREREPAPMVLLVLQVEGLARVVQERGVEAANILRRKLAVRLRAGLRASDVVAALAPDRFGVLLGHVEALADGERVAAKLTHTLAEPVTVAAQPCTVQARIGMALYPQHGKDAATLLQRAAAQATSAATLGVQVSASGFVPFLTSRGGAANDAG
jgi:GGDEF domain-containing protein